MVGVVISVIAFTIAVFTKSPETTTVIDIANQVALYKQ